MRKKKARERYPASGWWSRRALTPVVGAGIPALRGSASLCYASHPLIGRRIEGDLRELVVSYGATGYIALYRFDIQRDQVRVLALRHQREVGYLP